MPEAYIRGNTIKYIRVPEEVRFTMTHRPRLFRQGLELWTLNRCTHAAAVMIACFRWQSVSRPASGLHFLRQVIDKVQEENLRRDGAFWHPFGLGAWTGLWPLGRTLWAVWQ